MTAKSFSILNNPVTAAQLLLGSLIIREVDGRELIGRIVETEAYDQQDAASNSYRGRTPRTDVMFGSPGHAYVYFTYGMHYCMNIVTGSEGYGSAVLIRALEPIRGIEFMKLSRPNIVREQDLANGPAKLCQAMQIGKRFNGHDMTKEPLQLKIMSPINKNQIVKTTRIGISRDKERLWRFYIKDNPFVSKTS